MRSKHGLLQYLFVFSTKFFGPDIPLLREEGWTRHQEDVAKPPLKERTGWSFTSQVSECVLNMACCSIFLFFRQSFSGRIFPSSVRRGGRDIKKMSRSLL